MIKDIPIVLRTNSVFGPYLQDFVSQKQALGMVYNVGIEALNLFDSYCVKEGIAEPIITEELYNAWSKKRDSENETTQQIRVGYFRQFSRYLYNNGVPSLAVFHPLPKRSNEFIPYIFTEEELKKLFSAVDECNKNPIPGAPIRHIVLPVLFRVIYGCGLRVNEALKLKIDDVNLDDGSILIREGKGGKTRMVVMSDHLLEICRSYRENDLVKEFQSIYFFPERKHGYYDSSTIYAYFRKYLRISGISHGGRGKGPRLHDLRHTFAVNVLHTWAEQGKDIYVCLPILQQYLGHKKINVTEKYLRLTSTSYSHVTETFASAFGDIFPEVGT